MKKHILSGVLSGAIFGVFVAWGAISSAMPAGGLVALACTLIGVLAGAGCGWLIGINVAEGTFEEEEAPMFHGEMPAAH